MNDATFQKAQKIKNDIEHLKCILQVLGRKAVYIRSGHYSEVRLTQDEIEILQEVTTKRIEELNKKFERLGKENE